MRLANLALGFLLGAIVFIGASLVLAWTGPTSAPPNGNVSAPINVGTTDQIKNAGLGLNSLAVFGNAILSGTSRYLNFGSTAGSSGYGFRDNAGTMEFKSSGGTWQAIATSTSSGIVGGGCAGDGTGWGNAANCATQSCSSGGGVGSCPAGYTARKAGVTSSIACSGGAYQNCSCGSSCDGYSSCIGITYYPSYYSAPTLCIKN
jgi:hypothetical protein